MISLKFQRAYSDIFHIRYTYTHIYIEVYMYCLTRTKIGCTTEMNNSQPGFAGQYFQYLTAKKRK